jgi:hypothetical protein
LSVAVEVVSGRDLVTRSLVFRSFQLNGVPVYLPPITDRMEIRANRPEQRDIAITVYFRDLDRLEPIIDVIESEKVKVQGVVRADVEVGILATLARFSRTVPVEIAFQSSAPVRTPGGALVRNSTLRLLRAAAKVVSDVGPSVSRISLGRGTERRRALTDRFRGSVVLAGCAYGLRNSKGEVRRFVLFRAGTRISAKYFVLSTELLEPWHFNSDTAVLLASGDWSLAAKEPDLRVWFAGDPFDNPGDDFPSGGYSLRSQDIRLVATGGEQESKLVTLDQNGKTREIGLRNRSARQNLALFEIKQPPPWQVVSVDASDSKAEIVGAFRTIESWHTGNVTPELIPMSVGTGTHEFKLPDAIDSSGWGAPLVDDDSVVGIVLDETTGISFSQIKKLMEKSDVK